MMKVKLGVYGIPNRNGDIILLSEDVLNNFKNKLPVPINNGQTEVNNCDEWFAFPDPVGKIVDITWYKTDNGFYHVYGEIEMDKHPSWSKNCGFHDFVCRFYGTHKKPEDYKRYFISEVKDIHTWDLENYDAYSEELFKH